MSDEIRTEDIEVTETVEAEDVKEGLSATDYGVIGGIMLGGILVFEGGKWVWKKTEKPRKKAKDFITGIFSKKKPEDVDAKDVPEQEVATEKATEKSEEKKSDKKGNSKK